MDPKTGALESLLRRDRQILVLGLGSVILTAWIWPLLGAGMDMSALTMTRMAGMDGWLMRQADWTAGYATLIFFMWWVMMIAMMLPSASPVLLLFSRVHRQRRNATSPAAPTAAFTAGYLVSWGIFSLFATDLQWAMEAARLMSPMLETTNLWLGSAILIGAGLWQLTSIKARCLQQCRTPLGFLIGHWRAGQWGAFRMGLDHGSYCLGCCWFLMALLFFGGVMNLYWIAGLTIFVLLEKIVPFGHWFARAVGMALVSSGILLHML